MPASVSHSERALRAALGLLVFALPLPADAAEPEFMAEVAPASLFPDARHATRKEGVFMPPQTVRLITPGMTKRQVGALIGVPHFHEGLFGEHEWDYILNFYTGAGTQYRICRLHLRWDKAMRLDTVSWNDEPCRAAVHDIARRTAEAPASPTPVALPARPQPVTVHFAFDSAALSLDAQQALGALAQSVDGRSLTIVGHTDSSGSDAYNDRLSLARAEAVARYLQSLGIPASRLNIAGMGERDPARQTPDGTAEPANRRAVATIAIE